MRSYQMTRRVWMTKTKHIIGLLCMLVERLVLTSTVQFLAIQYSSYLWIVGIFPTTLIFLPWMEFWTAKSLLLFGRKHIGTSVMGWPPKKILSNLKISPWQSLLLVKMTAVISFIVLTSGSFIFWDNWMKKTALGHTCLQINNLIRTLWCV